MKKSFAVIIAIIILISTFFSVRFLANNCGHRCHDFTSSCQTCVKIEQAKLIISRLSTGAIYIIVALLCAFPCVEGLSVISLVFNNYSLIKQKIRLNN